MSDEKFWRKPREITRRIIVKGRLVLQSAVHFGGGAVDPFGSVDMTLLRDPLAGGAVLPGASIAGALRNYLRERETGYHNEEGDKSLSVALFGMRKKKVTRDDDYQSSLLVYDSLASEEPGLEFRDGVEIEPHTRTAKKGHKYDLEVLAAGTVFPLMFELVTEAKTDAEELKQALAIALQGFENGTIHLGAKKNRGLGRVKVDAWEVWDFDLTTADGLLNWLTFEQPNLAPTGQAQAGSQIAALLGTETDLDRREYFRMQVTFCLDGALLVRSAFGYGSTAADTVQLQAKQVDGSIQPVIPGSSFAGVIRHHALRIAKTLGLDRADVLVNQMFGHHQQVEKNKAKEKTQMSPSRVKLCDAVVSETKAIVQNRIRIDRFTGGAHEAALFAEQPVFGQGNSQVTLDLTLIKPKDREIGLLLQVLKDLWVGDLAVGGASSVGRGRLRGLEATFTHKETPDDKPTEWKLEEIDGKLSGNLAELEKFAAALYFQGEAA